MLVIGASLLIRTVYNLTSVDTGFDRSRLVTFSMTLAERYDPDTRAPAYQRLLDKLRTTPGVQGAAVMSGLSPNRSPEAIPTTIENHTASDGGPVEIICAKWTWFSRNQFAGRGFWRSCLARPPGWHCCWRRLALTVTVCFPTW
jgi:hypothetical protein